MKYGTTNTLVPVQRTATRRTMIAGGALMLAACVVAATWHLQQPGHGPIDVDVNKLKVDKLKVNKLKLKPPYTKTLKRWCNGQKTSAGMPTDRFVKNAAFCMNKCRANSNCGWVGFRRSDRYCEYWTAGSCAKGGHRQPGHDIYRVGKTKTKTTFTSTGK